ncbi:uncharacterized protein PAE49_010282 [Odontesthes bonariensis]|uniref:uncharacterized protein LOC142383687 n=1 Tax=Odontesthes bonariensis TaxID=219752 RepID=UPI003F5870D0
MPPFSTDDYHKLLQKIAMLETKMYRLEVNVEINGQYGNETTLPVSQNTEREQANRKLTGTTETRQEPGVNGKYSTSPPWNSLGAKPKHYKSPPSDVGRRLSGRTQHLETHNDSEWPALSHRNVSTPIPKKKPRWTETTTKTRSKLPQDTGILLENRFAPLSQNPDSPKERSSPKTGERYEAKLYAKRPQKELTTGPQTLIVGDGAVNEIKRFCSKKKTKILCFSNDMVSDISKKILDIVAEHPTLKSLIVHTGALDVVKQQSEVLKQDFMDLVNKVRCTSTEVFFSGPLPTVWKGDERFSRLMMLNRWLKEMCAAHSMNFIDNFNIFWGRRHLFKADGFHLNKSGVQLLSSNIFYSLRHTPAAPIKDKTGQNDPKRQIGQCSGEGAETRTDHGGQQIQKEPATSSSSPQDKESSPAPTAQQVESSPAPAVQQAESPPAPVGNPQPSPPRTPPSPQQSPLSLDSSLLDFPDRMKSFLNIGIQLTPRQNPIFFPPNIPPHPAPPIPPRPSRWKQPSNRSDQAPPPPLNHHIWDFNIHMDNNMDTNAKELCSLLDTFGLLQHVNGPTHTRGHTLDLVISKGMVVCD